jgi:hypothetical protein
VGLLVVGQPLIHRTQLAASVEAGFVVVVEPSDTGVFFSDFEESDFASDCAPSALAPSFFVLEALFDSPLSDVIDDEDAPRLSVL